MSEDASLLAPAVAQAFTAIVNRLATLAVEDEPLRTQLRALATRFLEATAEAAAPAPQPAEAQPAAEQREAAPREGVARRSEEPPEPPPQPREPLPPLTLGQAPPPETTVAPPVRWTTPTDADFPVIEARCRLKAEGARWAARRQRLIAEGGHFATEIEPRDREIIARAKALPDCFLWMCHPPSAPTPADLDLYDVVAACFENLAAGLSLVKQVLDEPQLHQIQFEEAIDLLAESQSALRASIVDLDGPPDSDQLRVFNWLRDTAAENRIFIQRYMRLDDPADPRGWPDLAARIETLDATLQEAQRKHKLRRKLLGKVRHKASLIEREPDQAEEHWRLLIEAVNELVAGGLPPSNPEMREMLLPVIGTLPQADEFPRGFQFVLREIERYAASSSPPEAAPREPATSPQIEEAARLLEGKSVVLIGGERRPPQQQAIEEAFRLRELIWLETREHQSIVGFEHSIARDDVAVVLLAIRWSSHSFGEAKDFCDKHAKPLVRLPGGYNPSQIAVQILTQCSERLQTIGT